MVGAQVLEGADVFILFRFTRFHVGAAPPTLGHLGCLAGVGGCSSWYSISAMPFLRLLCELGGTRTRSAPLSWARGYNFAVASRAVLGQCRFFLGSAVTPLLV